MPARPGLAKGKKPALLTLLRTERVRATDGRWRELFDDADVMSEGSTREENGQTSWYGFTSLILPLDGSTDEERAFFAAAAERDLHVRLRAIRIATREATLRAPAQIGRTACDVRVNPDPRGLRIDVDVQAPLSGGIVAGRPRG